MAIVSEPVMAGRYRLAAICVAVAVLAAPYRLRAGADEVWRVDGNEDGVQVFSRTVEGSAMRAIRAEVDVEASMGSALALLLDAPLRPRWDDNCVESSVYRQVSAGEDLVYVHNDLPWPVSDRDMLLRRTWSVAADGSRAQIRTTAANGVLPEIAGRVRLTQADGVWTIVRTGESTVRLSTEFHIDPGGAIPGRLVNSLSIQGPLHALANIRRMLEAGTFGGARTAEGAAADGGA